MADIPLCQKAAEVLARLRAYYGEPVRKVRRDPLSELILTILSQNTNDDNSSKAFEALRARFPTWQAVMEAPTHAVAEAIRVGGLANIKAPRIQQILRQIATERGALNLDFLAEMPTSQAREYLLALPGVGPKTAACVLLFSLGKPALPVDTHVHRVAERLGLFRARTDAAKAHEVLEALVPPEAYYPFHLLMIQHGRTLCAARKPQCADCPLRSLCAYAEAGASRPLTPGPSPKMGEGIEG